MPYHIPVSIGMQHRLIRDSEIVQFYLLVPTLGIKSRGTYAPASSGREVIRYILGMTTQFICGGVRSIEGEAVLKTVTGKTDAGAEPVSSANPLAGYLLIRFQSIGCKQEMKFSETLIAPGYIFFWKTSKRK